MAESAPMTGATESYALPGHHPMADGSEKSSAIVKTEGQLQPPDCDQATRSLLGEAASLRNAEIWRTTFDLLEGHA